MKKLLGILVLSVILSSCAGIDFQESGGVAFENANEVVVSNRGITSVISQVQAQRIAQSRCANYGKNAVYRGYVEYRYVFACTK